VALRELHNNHGRVSGVRSAMLNNLATVKDTTYRVIQSTCNCYVL